MNMFFSNKEYQSLIQRDIEKISQYLKIDFIRCEELIDLCFKNFGYENCSVSIKYEIISMLESLSAFQQYRIYNDNEIPRNSYWKFAQKIYKQIKHLIESDTNNG